MSWFKKQQSMVLAIFLVAFLALVSGCATTKNMAINKETQALDYSEESIMLMSLKTSNEKRPHYVPYVYSIDISANGKESEELFRFKVDKPIKRVKSDFNEYLLSFQLAPGNYKIKLLNCTSGIFPAIGTCYVPVHTEFEVAPGKIVYMGRIEATNRDKKSKEELRAGPVFPLLDQVLTGFSTGSFDVNIYDNYDKDISLFEQNFPLINGQTVEKNVLPPWVRPLKEKAQVNEQNKDDESF